MEEQALSGLKVIDLTWHIAGPYCTKLLADLGAEVVKIEQPKKGDPSREEGPFPDDKPNLETSGLFAYLNNNKKSVTLNLRTKRGVEMVKNLVKDADVLVENFRPGVMADLGLSYDELKAINPLLVMTSISNFGQSGEYRNYEATELIAQSMGGFLSSVGDPDREPLRAGGQLRILEYNTGVFAGMSTLTAVIGRRLSGNGEHLDVSITECGILQRSYPTVQNSYPTAPAKNTKRYMMMPSIEQCKDGYIGITLLTGQHWKDFCIMTEMYDWIDDERFTTLDKRLENKEIFQERLDNWLTQRTKKEIIALGSEWKIPVNLVPDFEEMIDLQQYQERGSFEKVNHPVIGEVMQPGAPFHMFETPWKIHSPAPLLGEHNNDIFQTTLGLSEEDIRILDTEGVI